VRERYTTRFTRTSAPNGATSDMDFMYLLIRLCNGKVELKHGDEPHLPDIELRPSGPKQTISITEKIIILLS
jgi:hypothetical protein